MRRRLIVAAIMAALLVVIVLQGVSVSRIKSERNRYEHNTESLLLNVEQYKIRDSLHAARVQSLELTVKEFERFRADDAALIKELKQRNRNLAAVNKTQSQTIIDLRAIPRDTVVVRDSVKVPAVAVHCGDAWYDFDGILADQEFTGTLAVRDSLMLVESVQYKRFWGFLWKTKKIRNRQLDVLSKCPHTKIVNCEHIVIEK